jgi:phage protein D
MVPGGSSGGVAFSALNKKYAEFRHPQASVELGGKQFSSKNMVISDIQIELTAGFEASVATFKIFNAYDMEKGEFRFEEIKRLVVLGNSLLIKLGYLGKLTEVFIGFVAGVTFGYDVSDFPYIEVTGMDIKGVMMSNSYAYQLSARSYSDAVREIFEKTAYENLRSIDAITKVVVDDTPDKQQGGGDKESADTIEMVSESDYEFVVKAAKKFNFEFFTDCGTVYFRKAKSNTNKLMDLKVGDALLQFEVGYALTGMVDRIEVCSMDAGTGKVITAKAKYDGKLSTGSKAKKMIKGSRHVYIDPSIISQDHADARAASLLEAMEFRLGSLRCECIGLPELKPGRFVAVAGMGVPVDNDFYLMTVTHSFTEGGGYKTKLQGCAKSIQG